MTTTIRDVSVFGDAMAYFNEAASLLNLEPGMRAILTMSRAMKAVEGRFGVCGLQPQVKAMLEACGYDRVVPIYESRDEAIATITT